MSVRAKCIAVLIVACSLGDAMRTSGGDMVAYSNDFREHYPKVGRIFDLSRYERETPAVVWNSAHEGKITIQRTRGDRYGYDQQRCVISVEGNNLKVPRYLSVRNFRAVTASWVTDKLILIKLDLGHVAGVEAIYDAERDTLIYCESVTCFIQPENSLSANWRTHSKTNAAPSVARR
jgi:hypothetical protein